MYCVIGLNDYKLTQHYVSKNNVTFQSGQTKALMSYYVLDDFIAEGNEKFILSIVLPLNSSVSLGNPSQATVTIQDDESE